MDTDFGDNGSMAADTRKPQKEEIRSEALIRDFAKDKDAAFVCNLVDGSYELVTDSESIRQYFSGEGPFPPAFTNYLNNEVHPDDAKGIKNELNNVRNADGFSELHRSRSFEYRQKKGEEYYWYRLVLSRISETEILIGLTDCDQEYTFKLVNDKLMGEYDAIYIVSLYRNRIRPVRPSRVSEIGNFTEPGEYSSLVKRFAEAVSPDNREFCIKFSDPAFVQAYMEHDDHRECVFEMPGVSKSMRRLLIDVIDRSDGVVKAVLISIAGVDDSHAQSIRLHMQLAEQATELEAALEKADLEAKRREMIFDLIGSGKWLYEINANDEVVSCSYSDIVANRLDQEKLTEPMGWFDAVYPEDRERVYNAFMAAIKDHSGNTVYNEAFRLIDKDGNLRWERSAGRVIRRDDGTAEYIGFSTDTTKQVLEQQKRMDDRIEIEQLSMKEQQLMHSEFRASVVAYMAENEGNIKSFLEFFVRRFRELVGCDQLIFRDESGNRYVSTDPELGDEAKLSGAVCRNCLYFDVRSPVYDEGVAEMQAAGAVEDGYPTPEGCPVKTALTRTVSLEGETIGYLAFHYIRKHHKFTDYERQTLAEFSNLLSATLSRNAEKERNNQLEIELEREKQAEHERMSQNYARILVLEDDFEALYDLELDSGRYDTFVKGDFYKRNINEKLVAETSFFDDLNINIDRVICEEDREVFHSLMTKNGILRKLSRMDHFDHYYRVITEEGLMWLKMRISYKNADKNNVIIGVFNAEEEMAAKAHEAEVLKSTQTKLMHEELRSEVLNYMVDNPDDDPIELLKVFAERIRELLGCDQVIYRDLTETRIMVNDPSLGSDWNVPEEYCQDCEHSDIHHPMYVEDYSRMDDCKKGWLGIPVHSNCPVKSSLTRIIKCDRVVAGTLVIRYVREAHRFTEIEERTLEEFARILSISLSRFAARKESKEKKRFDILHEIINSGQWTFYIDAQDKITDYEYSDGLIRITNSDLFDSVTKWSEAIHPEDRDSVVRSFRATIADHTCRTPYDNVYRMQDRTGEYRWYHSAGRIERDSDGNAEFYGIHINITEQIENERKQQRELEKALTMAESSNRAKTTFLNSMSHDIRTPMNAIIGYTNLAQDHIDNTEKVQNYLGKISQSSEHLLSLINDVLDMSRIESGKMNLDEKEENLSNIIHTLRDLVQVDITNNNLDFRIDAVDVYNENIICDKLRLTQVLLNLLSNACKYTPAGGKVTMRIAEKSVKIEGRAEFEFKVKDTGMGMDRKFLDTIFEPFTRVKTSTVSGIQGTGLGMTITKSIVDMMGGDIKIASEPGHGTEVTLLFSFKLQTRQKRTVEIPEIQGGRALIIDDTDTCLSMGSMLSEFGMRYEGWTSVGEAIPKAVDAMASGKPFTVFFLNWNLPDMTGIKAAGMIRKYYPETPIVLLTAYDNTEIEEDAKKAGITAFVSKPLFPSDLQKVLLECFAENGSRGEEDEENYDFIGKKILLVEDNELNLEIATDLLLDSGFCVDTAKDGKIAVDKMKRALPGDYDLILMDVQMPVVDGYEATRQIRALGTEITKIPIIALTANAFEEDRKLALDAGMNDHLPKPVDVEQLKKTMSKYL